MIGTGDRFDEFFDSFWDALATATFTQITATSESMVGSQMRLPLFMQTRIQVRDTIWVALESIKWEKTYNSRSNSTMF